MKDISKISISIDNTILSALKQMDKERVKLLLVFDGDNFKTLISIGDIQRAIIKNVDLSEKLVSLADFDKEYNYVTDSIDDVKKHMLEIRAECMPILDNNGQLVDVYFWNDFFPSERTSHREKINIPVVIMAGGKGSRLKPITNVIPKPLIPIDDKTIIEHIMDRFEAIGCHVFYLSVNYKYDILKFYLDNLTNKYDIKYFKEEKPLGTIGSVSLLNGKINTPFFVSNCDILINQDLRDVYNYHMDNKNDITIVTAVKDYKIPYGVIETGQQGLLESIKEKPEYNYMINTGVYILNSELIQEIPVGKLFHVTHLMEKIRKRGGRIGCFPISSGSWTDIGELSEYIKLIDFK